MTPENKKRLQDAARSGLEKSPYANMPVDQGLYVKKGEVITMRENLERMLASEKFYEMVDGFIKDNGITFDKYIERLDYPKSSSKSKPKNSGLRP